MTFLSLSSERWSICVLCLANGGQGLSGQSVTAEKKTRHIILYIRWCQLNSVGIFVFLELQVPCCKFLKYRKVPPRLYVLGSVLCVPFQRSLAECRKFFLNSLVFYFSSLAQMMLLNTEQILNCLLVLMTNRYFCEDICSLKIHKR